MTMRLEPEKQLGEQFAPLTQGGFFNSVQLCSVAVQHSMQRRGIGTVIMGRALDDFYEVATRTGVFAMTLVAANRSVVRFYADLGFVIYGDQAAAQPKMLLPAAAVIEARGG
jgi:GNAT superfamily N-acetyltransferase